MFGVSLYVIFSVLLCASVSCDLCVDVGVACGLCVFMFPYNVYHYKPLMTIISLLFVL